MLTNAHRRAVIKEIWSCCYSGGYSDGFTALGAYERAVKELP